MTLGKTFKPEGLVSLQEVWQFKSFVSSVQKQSCCGLLYQYSQGLSLEDSSPLCDQAQSIFAEDLNTVGLNRGMLRKECGHLLDSSSDISPVHLPAQGKLASSL